MVITLDPLPFGNEYSVKNIPLPRRKEHNYKLIYQGNKFMNNLRWTIWHFLTKNGENSANESLITTEENERYSFKIGNAVLFIPETQELEKKFWLIIKYVKYYECPNELQTKLKEDLNQLQQLDKIIVFADRSNKKYCNAKSDYMNEVQKYVTSTYRKVDNNIVKESNIRAAQHQNV